MPEKPKRRKNNKNKRRNKNNRADTFKNNNDLNSDIGETCSNQNINEGVSADASDSNCIHEIKTTQEDILESSIDNNFVNLINEGSLNGDLNNNSDQNIINLPNSSLENIPDADVVDSAIYVVEPPDRTSNGNKPKLKNVKSKSLDNEDNTNIVDITEDASELDNVNSLALIDTQNVVVTHVDSDIEWEVADDLRDIPQIQETATGTLSITTLPLAVLQFDQNKALTDEEEKSLRSYLKTINLVTQPESVNTIEINTEIQEVINQEIKHRLRKRGSADDFFLHRIGPSRILDVIDEEGSSESSMTSRRQSYLSDKKSDIEDLDDDVFEDKNKTSKQKSIKSSNIVCKKAIGKLIPQECLLVGAKMKDPDIEARGDWTVRTVEQMTGAEVVYLTDTSSSSSSLHEIGDDDDGVETDVSVRMITPTIEVTDTENFFKKSFIRSDKNENKNLEDLQLSSNKDYFKSDENIKQAEGDKNEHIIKVEYADDVPKIIQNDRDNIISKEEENDIQKREENDNQINNRQDSLKTFTKPNEHLIKIEIEKNDSRSEDSEIIFGAHSDHEIVVLSTDNIETNLYVKDLDEMKTVTENIPENTEKCGLLNANIPQTYDKLKKVQIVDTETTKHLQNINKTENNQQISKVSNDKEKPLDFATEIETETKRKDSKYLLEAKVIKCEFNDAINNLINEVSNEFERANESPKDSFTRQDSSSSLGSSQCTAKYNPTSESLNDISNIVHDEITVGDKQNLRESLLTTSHIKDVCQCISESNMQTKCETIAPSAEQPLGLKDLCVLKIATLPYGDKILEELASVSKRLHDFTTLGSTSMTASQGKYQGESISHGLPDTLIGHETSRSTRLKKAVPPPVQPRHSSLKKSQDDDQRTASSTKNETAYVCLSPSQKMLMDKTHTVITKEYSRQHSDLSNTGIERNDYNESDKKQKLSKEYNNVSESPNVSFKSQTGSRLLALIRDPTLTRNINSLNDRINNSETKRTSTIFAENNHESLNINKNFLFKPIPPPRPKKYSTSIYESDENSDFTDNSLRSIKRDRKLFHYSTGTLNKEIENDVSSIQNMHRFLTDTRDQLSDNQRPRRPSLPKDLCDQQMEYIRQKEKEIDAELKRLEGLKHNINSTYRTGPKAPLISEKEVNEESIKDNNNYSITRKRDVIMSSQNQDGKKGKISSLFNSSQEELLREKMYSEYVTQMAEREERKQHKVIKITNTLRPSNLISKSMSALDAFDAKVNNRIEKEFISKARERWDKLGIRDPETEDERECAHNVYKEPKVIEHKIKVIESGEEKDVKKLPSHLQEFVKFTAKDKDQSGHNSAIWRPGAPPPVSGSARSPGAPPPPPPPPIWSPGSAGASPQTPRKTFRPVHFEESPPTRRKFESSEQNGCTSGSESESRLRTSQSAPVTGLSTLGGNNVTTRLPRAQNPTVTLLQKARGQLSRGSYYVQQEKDAARLPRDRPSPPRGDPVHALRKEYASESEVDRSDYERGGTRKMADAHRKVEGIGPITKDGMPVALRSEVKDPSRWYKKMYDTIHKNKYDDDYVTIRYKSRRGQPPERVSSNKSQYAYFDPRSGYLSEPEGGLSRLGSSTWSDAYDSDITTGPRRRTASVQEERRFSEASSPYMPSNNKYSTLASARASQEIYKNQPGRIEDYVPGKSSVIDKESKQWWDEVMDIFDGQNISSTTSLPQASPKDKKDLTATILSKSNMARALKESGYESDSTLVFRRREDTDGPLSPAERRAAYRDLQAGGEPPLRGFRSPAPPRQESPRRYVESDVNIHYRCPVRQDPLPLVPERELARQQAEHMKRLYREQKRNKYLQELQDMQNRRHQDNFTPSQKNILPLNRYDEADKVIAKALYSFNGQTSRELSFRKGEMIHVRRQIDNNWYEGELHGRVGLFPYNYVEIQKGDIVQTSKKPVILEGRARAKFDFTAQTNLELPLKKGEIVVLTRRIDQNWWEGRNGAKTGIFPDSYVTVLQEPSPSKPEPQPMQNSDKPIASPAAHGLLNGTAKRSMGAHSYTPQQNSQALSNAPPATQPLPGYVAKPAQASLSAAERGYGPPSGAGVDLNNTEPLYVDTNAEAIPYRAMYKYRPQNPDELELNEGDTVYVLEKCDDGWYVGSSQRTGRFGTFPGNYVERI